ncbi:MAG: hypothetical protein NTV80_09070 [Verrucomicrobia bacterium]|nr:hypothetical protein [Verrucomicrobiota bacterium]
MDETLMLAVEVAMVFERLGVSYFIGGSLASSQHGVPRATLDADMVARLGVVHVTPLLEALGEAWYADEAAIREAISCKASFNLIHLDTAQKVDVFVSKDRPFEQSQFTSSLRLSLGDEDIAYAPYFATAEHSILAKLEWFRIGGELSDRQWNDILGILRVQAGKLDQDSLGAEARELGVADLLEKAIAEAK